MHARIALPLKSLTPTIPIIAVNNDPVALGLVSNLARPGGNITGVPERHILVLGDAMADWLAYGLEDVYADQPDMGVIRKHKTVSGLIKYQPKGNPADWAAAAKGILASEKADAIVVMLGLDDRVAIREPAVEKSDNKLGNKDTKAKPDAKPSSTKPAAKPDGLTKMTDPELSPDDAAGSRPVMEPEKSAHLPNGRHVATLAATVFAAGATVSTSQEPQGSSPVRPSTLSAQSASRLKDALGAPGKQSSRCSTRKRSRSAR